MMEKSAYSKKIEHYAASLEGAYDAFVLAMWSIPQKHGVDEKFWQWVEANQPDKKTMSIKCMAMALAEE